MVRSSRIRKARTVLLGLGLFALVLAPFSATYAAGTPAATPTPPASTAQPATAPVAGAGAPAAATPTIGDTIQTAACATGPGIVCGAVAAANGATSLASGAVKTGETIGKCLGTGLIDCAITGIGTAMLKISTFFLGIAGVLFNLVVVKTVFQFSQLIGNSPGLLLAWGILRDLGNMALLFGFIFMGLATILDLHTYNAKKALPMLIIFAVLMNFSLFAAEGIIDTSNVFSTILYSQANNAPCGFSGTVQASGTVGDSASLAAATSSNADCINTGIAGSIMQASGLSTMFRVKNGLGIQDISVYLGLSLFAIIGAIVMFAASIMLTIRAITLTFLMVFAPIGFAGMAIPPLHNLASKWWNQLLHQAFFAPLLLLLIFISLKVTEGLGSVSGDGLAGAMLAPGTSTMGVILIFVIVIGFLLGSLRAANSFGAIGAGFAINAGKTIVRAPLGAASGFLGRNTIGRGASMLQKKYEPIAARSKILSGNYLGIDSGVAGVFGAAKKAKFGGGTSFEDKEHRQHARHEELEQAARGAKNQSDLNKALALPDGTDRDDKIAEILQRMSVKEIEQLKAMKHADDTLDTLAQNLSPEKFAALMKEGSGLNETQKADARNARFKELAGHRDTIKTSTDPVAVEAAKKAIRQYSSKDLQNAPPELLADDAIIGALSDTQRDDLIKSNEVNPASTRKLRSADPVEKIKKDFTDGKSVATAVRDLKPKKAAKLPDDVLASADVVAVISPEALRAIDTDGDLSNKARSDIMAELKKRTDARMVDWLKSPAGQAWVV